MKEIKHRRIKVEEQIRHFLLGLITSGSLPPIRVAKGEMISCDGLIVIDVVIVSPDLKTVKVYFHHFDESKNDMMLEYLTRLVPVVKKLYASKIASRFVPHFEFILDDHYKKIQAIDSLISRVR